MKQIFKIEFLTISVITLFGLFQNQVSVFYIIYLFWFQEFIRTIVDFVILLFQQNTFRERISVIKALCGSFFLLFVYLVFIIALFGVKLEWNNKVLLKNNILIFLFRNWYFNINCILFLGQYIYFRTQFRPAAIQLSLFNPRHLVLHLAIVLGAIIQLIIAPKLSVNNIWTSLFVVTPFLMLKFFIDKRAQDTAETVSR